MRRRVQISSKAIFAMGCVAVLLINLRAFSTGSAVPWDGRDQWFFFLWMGSSLHAHHFPDWMPHILSGYPLGSILPVGLYNPLYLLLSYLFPHSALSINLLQLIYQLSFFSLTYFIARSHRLSPLASAYAGLAFTVSGYVMGHASQTAMLASCAGWLMLYLGLRLSLQSHSRWAPFLGCAGSLHLLTAGYPSLIAFGAQVLLILIVRAFIVSPQQRTSLLRFIGSAFLGALISIPALWHFFHWIGQSSRSTGLNLEEALWGSLPPRALLNFFVPWMGMGREQAQAIDPTMDRFHLLATTPLLAILALTLTTKLPRKQLYVWCGLGLLFLLLALGRHDPLGLRSFLTNHVFVYRYGRFPSADHRGFALFCWALLGAAGAEALWARWQKRFLLRTLLIVCVLVDFASIAAATLGLRYTQLPDTLRHRPVLFEVEFQAEQINRPRLCDPHSRYEIEEWSLPPDRFSWHGLHNFVSNRYMTERDQMAWALCGPSRLWDSETRRPLPFSLETYSPGHIRFVIQPRNLQAGNLLWADVNDGLWKLRINGEARTFVEGPAALRYISLSKEETALPSLTIEMIYAGPLSRFWR